MRQAVGIHADMTLDTANQFAAVKPFVFRRVRILHTLRVHDEETSFFAPPKALSHRANHIFLTPLREGCVRSCRGLHSISENIHSTSAMSENPSGGSRSKLRTSVS